MENTNKNAITVTIRKGNTDEPFMEESYVLTPIGYDAELERNIIKMTHTDFDGYEDTIYHNSMRVTRIVRNEISDILDNMIKEWKDSHNV